MTYSYVKLTVSPACYDEIRRLLVAATHGKAIMKSGNLDMTGFALVRGAEGPEHFRFPPPPLMPGATAPVPIFVPYIGDPVPAPVPIFVPYVGDPVPAITTTCET